MRQQPFLTFVNNYQLRTMTKLMRGVLQLLFVTALFHQSAIGQTHEQGFEAMMMEKWDKAIDVYSSLTKSNNADQLAWLSHQQDYTRYIPFIVATNRG